MRCLGSSVGLLLLSVASCAAADPPPCSQAARAWSPCEMRFSISQTDLSPDQSPYKDELVNVEFRSPRHSTNLIRAFSDGGPELRIRFNPTEGGVWTYHVTSQIKRYNDQEGTFTVADSDRPGFVSVANVRHWRAANKQPHLWLSAAVPFMALDQNNFEAWLEARKHNGFTHVRGILLNSGSKFKPLSAKGEPDPAYFAQLDERLLAADARGFTLDLVLADQQFAASGALTDYATRGPLLRYLVARYGSLNVTWQGVEHFEELPGSRALLRQINEDLKRFDTFGHPRSSDARDSSSPLLSDGWMDYLIEGWPRPDLGAVEHQFTSKPEIHVVNATAPDAFRHELWNCTANGEYPSVSYEALQNPANVKVVETWWKVVSDTRHWELEPYFDVDGARAVGLNEVEYLAYAQTPGIVEITLPKHKYNPVWIDPISGEEAPLKDYRGEVFSRQTPDSSHDWILQVPREGHKEAMLRSYRFESEDPPIQEPELDPARTPFGIVDPGGDELNPFIPIPFSVKLTRTNRATRSMQYVWWGEVVAGGEGTRVLASGVSGTFNVPDTLRQAGANMNMRILAINANGKAYEVDRVYRLVK